MKKIIKQVTVTGADDSVTVKEMVEIQKQYPFVEWGILLSKTSEGRSRFPTQGWIERLCPFKYMLTLSGHVCGRWVRDICEGKNTMYEDRSWFDGLFGRYQLNFHACLHKIQHGISFTGTLLSLNVKQVIFQFDEVNDDLLKVARKNHIDAVPLFDTSGGAGVLPQEWPMTMNVYSGYAGGLSPENLVSEMERIEKVCDDGPIWIDAETRLRSDDDQQFDLEKVVRFLEEAKPWVLEEHDGSN